MNAARRPSRARPVALLAALAAALAAAPRAHAAFDLQLTLQNPGAYTPDQFALLTDAAAQAEALWESIITGYQEGIDLGPLTLDVQPFSAGLAEAQVLSTTRQGGFTLATSGVVRVNPAQLESLADWPGTRVNVIDELMAHEIGHALGIGTLWIPNGVYRFGSFQYTGVHGLAAYRDEFDPAALFIPVESAGGPGTANSHWDQLMRSSPQEGNPADPFSLSPLVGITDALGRDLALELMTGALDPDFGEPFLSRTTVASLRDLGFTVIPEPAALGPAWLALWLLGPRRLCRS